MPEIPWRMEPPSMQQAGVESNVAPMLRRCASGTRSSHNWEMDHEIPRKTHQCRLKIPAAIVSNMRRRSRTNAGLAAQKRA